jgi:hypothetical protein
MIAQVRHFVQAYGDSRFDQLNFELIDNKRAATSHSRAGYVNVTGKSNVYYFFSEVFRNEVCKSYDRGQVLTALKEAGHLVTDTGRWDKQERLGNNGRRQRFFAVKDSILDEVGDCHHDLFDGDADGDA